MAENPNQEIKVTVDGGQFYSFVRALKRSSRASDLGEVVMSLGQAKLTIETRQGGSILPCGECLPAVARIKGGNFLRMVSLVTDAMKGSVHDLMQLAAAIVTRVQKLRHPAFLLAWILL